MNYKKMTAVLLAGACLLSVLTAEAAKKDNPAEEAQKRSGSRTVIIKPGPRGGISIITAQKEQPAPAEKGKNPKASKGRSAAKQEQPAAAEKGKNAKASRGRPAAKQERRMLVEEKGKFYFLGTELPADYRQISIFGEAEATREQAVALIKANNPKVRLACSVEELVDLYWQEAERENVRPDLALAQSLVETGSYSYGGDVKHKQNNFCGLGTVGGGARGASFKTPELGVRAHIQHLLAYTQKKRPSTKIVDPRYELAHNIRLERGMVDTWYGLNGTWAMGSYYCEKIMASYQRMLSMEGGKKRSEAEEKKEQKESRRRKTMRERVEELLKEG